jgi:hypothetical protein
MKKWIDHMGDGEMIACARYRVLKPMKVDGLEFGEGDYLPGKSGLRSMPERIRLLVDQNFLQPILEVEREG